ncbi:hypothetical protein HPB50_006957 [Hyalomma asiaticum]|uniref:Uncharacterized protein n=1 Tax=Hyalomma asiaticum TaxID=266040 RepID=A0ACB7TFZ5_HYAAI|nr:hypothetical protein HPB50_006957 [Hyalomma asiaticum]
MPRLLEEVKASLEEPLSEEEFGRGMDSLNSGKSRGPDRLVSLDSRLDQLMAGYHCDPDAQPACNYFLRCMARYIEEFMQQECVPEWLSQLEPVAALKEL